ncbi:MAG TPA: exodeoxyribonuclease VII large subunit [Candidatus Baltobacteraceae bacterium]|nr:exodeoxyribonuclease VII large subunit [Candidatus Baltobacteraceae bacterium]
MNEAAPILQVTVSQFSDRLRRLVEQKVPALRRIAVVGEISDWKPQNNGNVYFNLKDDRAVLRCFAFSGEAKAFPAVSDGVAVVATGSVGIWERRSEYQLRVLELAPFGVGALAAKVEALRKKLQAEGLFDDARKRTFPRFPHRVALVSARGKGAADFETTLREKAPNVVVSFIETRVQGEGAEIDIADAIDRAARERVDAIVLLRGGGSYEDRYPFNTEPVVRAIIRSRYPVVTAIGHTGDRHLADEAADAVFKTPTAAAEYIAGSWTEVTRRLADQHGRLRRAVSSIVVRAAQRSDVAGESLVHAWERWRVKRSDRLNAIVRRLLAQNPSNRVQRRVTHLTALQSALRNWGPRALPQWRRALEVRSDRLARAHERYFSQRTRAVEVVQSRLDLNDPLKPLERGYAIVSKDGRALRDARETLPGDEIEARLFVGSLTARVEKVSEDG